MGVLNVTPDSFSDGGQFFDLEVAINAGQQMARDGADLIDVGGESTRPGSEGVAVNEELRRVVPVVSALAARGIRVSIDTMKPAVAHAALQAGASMVNDVSGLRDPAMRKVCADQGCEVAIMHMRGEPRTMQLSPTYKDVVSEVRAYLLAQAIEAEHAGINPAKIWLDPGIGFGKTLNHNLKLVKHLDKLVDTGYQILVGASRKSFLGKILSGEAAPAPVDERLEGTLVVHAIAQAAGVKMIRAHDVPQARRAIDTCAAVMEADQQ